MGPFIPYKVASTSFVVIRVPLQFLWIHCSKGQAKRVTGSSVFALGFLHTPPAPPVAGGKWKGALVSCWTWKNVKTGSWSSCLPSDKDKCCIMSPSNLVKVPSTTFKAKKCSLEESCTTYCPSSKADSPTRWRRESPSGWSNLLPNEIGNGPWDEHDTGSPKFCKEMMIHASLKAAPPMQHAAASASESSE